MNKKMLCALAVSIVSVISANMAMQTTPHCVSAMQPIAVSASEVVGNLLVNITGLPDLSGITITVTGNGNTYTAVTGSQGQAAFSKLPVNDAAGNSITYTIRETIPEGYLAASAMTTTLSPGATVIASIPNTEKTYTISIDCKDYQTGDAVSGGLYTLYHDGEVYGTYTIQEDGTLCSFPLHEKEYEGTWEIQMTQAPEGYLLDSTLQELGYYEGDTFVALNSAFPTYTHAAMHLSLVPKSSLSTSQNITLRIQGNLDTYPYFYGDATPIEEAEIALFSRTSSELPPEKQYFTYEQVKNGITLTIPADQRENNWMLYYGIPRGYQEGSSSIDLSKLFLADPSKTDFTIALDTPQLITETVTIGGKPGDVVRLVPDGDMELFEKRMANYREVTGKDTTDITGKAYGALDCAEFVIPETGFVTLDMAYGTYAITDMTAGTSCTLHIDGEGQAALYSLLPGSEANDFSVYYLYDKQEKTLLSYGAYTEGGKIAVPETISDDYYILTVEQGGIYSPLGTSTRSIPIVLQEDGSYTDYTPESQDILYGDVNLDGKVELTDAILLSKACAGQVTLTEEANANGDCNASGNTDTEDSVTLLRFLLHLENSLPVTK